jgi:hypothetical protein
MRRSEENARHPTLERFIKNKIDSGVLLSQQLNLSTPQPLILGFAMNGSLSILER